MKHLSLLILIISLFIISCEKDNRSIDQNGIEYLTEIGTTPDCGSCSQISATIKPGPEENGCCTYTLIIKAKKACGHRVVINGDTIGQVNSTLFSLPLIACPGETVLVQIYGRDAKNGRWNSICYTEDVECNGCSCENTRLGVVKLDEEQGCCTYQINAEALPDSTNNCEYLLTIGNQNYSLDNASLNQQVIVCEDKTPVSLTVNGKVCKKEELACNCCDGVSYEINSAGPSPNGCCTYIANIFNDDQCDLFLFDQNLNVINTIPLQNSITEFIEVCPKNSPSEFFYVGTDRDNICKEIELYGDCSNADCCTDVTFVATSLGQNNNNCCEYQFEITNNSTCKQIFYNEIGYAKVIEPGQTVTEIIEFCFSSQVGLFQDFYIGPDQNPKNACRTETISLVCN